MGKTRILLVDDHGLIRKGIHALLAAEIDFEVVAEAESGREAIDLVREHLPDVVIMDVSMPDMNGILATRRITSEFENIKVLALSMHPVGNMVAEMLKAGSSGYLTKNCASDELVSAVRMVHANKIYLSPEISRSVVEDYITRLGGECDTGNGPLSSRESEVLQLVAEGKPTKMIATMLCISEKTVGAHRQSIMDKLGIRSIAELTKYAIREGLTPLE